MNTHTHTHKLPYQTLSKTLPLATSSKLDLASKCLSRDLGVKMISCLGKGKEKASVTDKQQIDPVSRVFIVCAEKTPEEKKSFYLFSR